MFKKIVEQYQQSHTHPVNRALHFIGIPAIVISLPLFFFHWQTALGLFIGGGVIQFIGHSIEGTPPVFLKHPTALLVAPIWWVRKLLGKK